MEIPKGYIYFAMAFSFLVDILQMQMNKKHPTPVPTYEHYKKEEKNLDKGIL